MIKLCAYDAKLYNRVKRNEQPAAERTQSSLNKGVKWDKDWLMGSTSRNATFCR